MSEWRTIDTAPKDGSYVLLGDREANFMVGFWRDGAWDDGDFRDHERWPTHWMPLEAPDA